MEHRSLSCPSTRADQPDAVVFGVVGGTAEAPMVAYLTSALPASDDVLGLAAPVTPPEVFRFGGTCVEKGCRQFEDGRCSIAARLVSVAEPVVRKPPRCAIRSTCRWWAEQGASACVRCPSVVTVDHAATPAAVAVAGGHFQ
jgi:hypothetical protein